MRTPKSRKRIAWAAVPLVAIALLAAGCGSSGGGGGSSKAASSGGQESAQSSNQTTIYFATFAIANSFWGAMKKGAEEAAAQTGAQITWTQGTEFSTSETVKRMEVAISTKPDVLVVSDIEPSAFEPLMKKAQEDGIAVIDINAESPSKTPPYLLYVGANEYEAGQEAARHTLEAGTPTGAACEIQALESAALHERCKGYEEVLSAKGVPVELVNVAGTPSQTEAKMEGYFTSHEKTNAAYLLTSEPAYLAPMIKVKQKFASRNITLITNDTSEEVFERIKSGEVLGTIGQQQYLQGYLPVIYGSLYEKYGFLPADPTLTGPSWIDKSNVAQTEKQESLG
ncbi:MAG TPA: substrate-binding domain-containing protein [Solirubrobacteraceae bacterium]|jgi:simple sugar transport system substrate-binding protein